MRLYLWDAFSWSLEPYLKCRMTESQPSKVETTLLSSFTFRVLRSKATIVLHTTTSSQHVFGNNPTITPTFTDLSERNHMPNHTISNGSSGGLSQRNVPMNSSGELSRRIPRLFTAASTYVVYSHAVGIPLLVATDANIVFPYSVQFVKLGLPCRSQCRTRCVSENTRL